MRAPPGRNPVIGHWGVDLGLASWNDGAADVVAPGAFMYFDEHGELPCGLFVSFDYALAAFARSRAWQGSERPVFPVLRPLLGVWWWVESPGNTGVLTGIRAGGGKVIAGGGPERAVLVEYCAYRLEDTAGGKATVLQAVTVSFRWRR